MTVIAHHLVWTAYGTWLPNDPRGSGSTEVYTARLKELGDAHLGRRRVQPPRRAVREFYALATPKLLYEVIRFNAAQIRELGGALAEVLKQQNYKCFACAIMPDHVHLVIRKHRHPGEEMIERLQRGSRLRFSFVYALTHEHPLWTKGGWNRFLSAPGAVRSRIQYVEDNPVKEGMSRQAWPFVEEYDGWPLHRKTPTRQLNRKR